LSLAARQASRKISAQAGRNLIQLIVGAVEGVASDYQDDEG
jgi:hypothetical protein